MNHNMCKDMERKSLWWTMKSIGCGRISLNTSKTNFAEMITYWSNLDLYKEELCCHAIIFIKEIETA